MSSNVVTRFAPSNTGILHAGSARTALFSWAYARGKKGKFILRIEDTDQARSTEESLKSILEDMRWLGFDWDEGPDIGGNNGPYRQSERLPIYNDYLDKLIKEGFAYEKEGAIRINVEKAFPHEYIEFNDLILGRQRVKRDQVNDFVIKKSDGFPTYHLAVVVDDHTMGVNHIFRAQEHLSNTPKHIVLQSAMNFPQPFYAHIPIVLNQDGSKMSKRQKTGMININDFRKLGILPSTIVNYLSLLGWSPGNNVEHFDKEYLFDKFDICSVNKSNARFDMKKLLSFSKKRLSSMDKEVFINMARDFSAQNLNDVYMKMSETGMLPRALSMFYGRSSTLSDPLMSGSFLVHEPTVDQKEAEKVLYKDDNAGIKTLSIVHDVLRVLDVWDASQISSVISGISNEHNLSKNKVSQPIRIAITGSCSSPPIEEVMETIGRQECLNRIASLIKKG